MSKPSNRTHHVSTRDGGTSKVEAAYYTHEPTFTVFKATDGAIVASFHNNELVSIVIEVCVTHGRVTPCTSAPTP